MFRHAYRDHPENEYIKWIRNNELRNPAPFSTHRLLVLDHLESYRICPELTRVNVNPRDLVGDVPITEIVAIQNASNLDNFEFGMTFRDVLFCCMHGHSLIRESLDYFLGDSLKADSHLLDKDYRPYPQAKAMMGRAYGRGGVGLIQRGGKFFIDQGQQRSLLAMFWIYQNEGVNGRLKQVRICRDA